MKTKLHFKILILLSILLLPLIAKANTGEKEKPDSALSTNLNENCIDEEVFAETIRGFTLVDADTNTDIYKMKEGGVIDIDIFVNRNLNIRVDQLDDADISVNFALTGPINRTWTENVTPYALFGDINGDYDGVKLPAGDYFLEATAYYRGFRINDTDVNFSIGEDTNAITSFNLIDAEYDRNLYGPSKEYYINDGQIFDKNKYVFASAGNPIEVSINAITNSYATGSVSFELSGPISYSRVENVEPFTLFGDFEGNFYGQIFPVGSYTLVATPYSEANKQGDRGEVLTITFTIIDDEIVEPKILDLVYGIGGDGGPFDSAISIMEPTEPIFEQPAVITALGNPVTKSVEMALTSNNGFSYNTVENSSPLGFSLFGTQIYPNGIIGPSTPPTLKRGTYSLTMTPYSEFDKGGEKGETITKQFEFAVIDKIEFFEYSNETYNFDRFFSLNNGVYFNNLSPTRNHFTLPVAIKATTSPEEVGSVKFEIENENGFSHSKIENVAPYTLFGDSNGVFNTRLLPEGTYHLTATAFSEPNGKGDVGRSSSITFYITNYFETVMPEIRLIEAESAAQITTLSANQKTKIDQSVTPTDNVNIIAEYDCGILVNCPESVYFMLTGGANKTTIESNEPYSLFGDYDSTGTFLGESLPVGEYTLTVWGYSEDGAKGISTRDATFNFEIINSNALLSKAKNTVLYPNPASNTAFVKTEDHTAIFKTVILDVTGKKVKEYSRSIDSEQAIDVSGLKKGLYFVQIYTGNERITKKLVVQ